LPNTRSQMPDQISKAPQSGFVRAAFTTVAYQAGGFALAAIWAIVLARGLGPEQRGTYAIISTLVSIASTLGTCGFTSANTYFRAKQYPTTQLVGNSLLLSLICVIFMTASVASVFHIDVLARYLARNEVSTALLWLAIPAASLNVLYVLLNNVLLGSNDIRGYNLPNVIYHGTFALILVLFTLVCKRGLLGATLALVVANGITAAALLCRALYHTTSGFARPRVVPATMKKMTAYAWKAYAGTLSQLLNSRVDMLLVGYYLTPSLVGQYAVAISIADWFRRLPSILAVLLLPRVASSAAEEGEQLTGRVVRCLLITQTIACSAMAAAANLVIVRMFGHAYANAVPVLIWIMPGSVAVTITSTLSAAFAGRGKPEVSAQASLISFAIYVGAGSIMIPQSGLVGAAWAWSISNITASTALSIRYVKMTGAGVKFLVPTSADAISLFRVAQAQLQGRTRRSTAAIP
jgi:O-antigen/teichoic acid export membrane protein